jgi:hypothetical protein
MKRTGGPSYTARDRAVWGRKGTLLVRVFTGLGGNDVGTGVSSSTFKGGICLTALGERARCGAVAGGDENTEGGILSADGVRLGCDKSRLGARRPKDCKDFDDFTSALRSA